MSEYTHLLLATLGGQPQIVTFTLDLLLQRNIPISEVIVIHPQATQLRLKRSLDILSAEFAGDRYRNGSRKIHFRSHILRRGNQPLTDIVDDISANAALNTIHSLIRDLKQEPRPIIIHLSVSGGRRLMSLLAISAALLKFEHTDHIWHIYTPDDLRKAANEGAIMHVPPGSGVELIEGPFAFWGPYFPNLPQYASDDANTIIRKQRAQMDVQERERCEQVEHYPSITPRELATLKAFADGLNPQQVADRLGVTVKTIDTYKTHLLDYCRAAWPDTVERLDYHFLYKRFASYFNTNEYSP